MDGYKLNMAVIKKKTIIIAVLLFAMSCTIFANVNAMQAPQTTQYTDKALIFTPAPVISHGLNTSASATNNASASKIKIVNMHINTDMSLIHTKNISISKATLKFPKIKATKEKIVSIKPIRMQSNFRMPHFKL